MKLKKMFLFVLYLTPLFSIAQSTGIHFEQGLSWQQVLQKAKQENKYIFVDCYATWCGPCKQMDIDVYPKDSVGNYMNSQFVSVKVQMDTSDGDNNETRKWYMSAHDMQQAYNVGVYPTYLFFSPDGEIVHRESGVKKINDFISLVRSAIDHNQQYYTLLKDYQSGKKEYSLMPYLVRKAKEFGNNILSDQLAADYIHDYLEKADQESLCHKEILEFINAHSKQVSSDGKIFYLYYHYPEKVDSIMQIKGYANGLINAVINYEEITPILTQGIKDSIAELDWKVITRRITEKFGKSYVNPGIVNAKVRWYSFKKDWKNYTKYTVQKVEETLNKNVHAGTGWLLFLNNNAFEVFKYSNKKEELNKALGWADRALIIMPNFANVMDTKANLLYKLGKRMEAISLEEKSVNLDQKNTELKENLNKMKRNEKTWDTISNNTKGKN